MMELGATICLPRNPQCLICPVADLCRARAAGTQNELPAKKRPKQIRVERTLLAIRRGKNEMLFWRRPDTDRKLAGFWELPEPQQLPDAVIGTTLGRFTHSITNFHNIFTIVDAQIIEKPAGYSWLPYRQTIRLLVEYDHSKGVTNTYRSSKGLILMQRSSKILVAKCVTILSIIPVAILANITGPPPASLRRSRREQLHRVPQRTGEYNRVSH